MEPIPYRDYKVLEINELLSCKGFKYVYMYLDKLMVVEKTYIDKFINRIIDESDLIELNSHIANCKLLIQIKTDLEDSLKSLADEEESNVTESVAVQNTTDFSWRNKWQKMKRAALIRLRLA